MKILLQSVECPDIPAPSCVIYPRVAANSTVSTHGGKTHPNSMRQNSNYTTSWYIWYNCPWIQIIKCGFPTLLVLDLVGRIKAGKEETFLMRLLVNTMCPEIVKGL